MIFDRGFDDMDGALHHITSVFSMPLVCLFVLIFITVGECGSQKQTFIKSSYHINGVKTCLILYRSGFRSGCRTLEA